MASERAVVIHNRANFQNLLTQAKGSFAQASSRYLSADRFVKLALVAASRQPKLYECTQESILKELMTACQLGLDPTGTMGQGWLVPFWNKHIKAREAVFIPGYRGLILLAVRCGVAKKIEPRLVYKGDKFAVFYGSNPRIEHTPSFTGSREVTYAYAVATLADGVTQFEVMTIDELEEARKQSKKPDDGPWRDHRPDMQKKTVVRRLIKYLAVDTEKADLLASAWEADERAERQIEAISISSDPFEAMQEVKAIPEEKPAPPKKAPKPKPKPAPPKEEPAAKPEPLSEEEVVRRKIREIRNKLTPDRQERVDKETGDLARLDIESLYNILNWMESEFAE